MFHYFCTINWESWDLFQVLVDGICVSKALLDCIPKWWQLLLFNYLCDRLFLWNKTMNRLSGKTVAKHTIWMVNGRANFEVQQFIVGILSAWFQLHIICLLIYIYILIDMGRKCWYWMIWSLWGLCVEVMLEHWAREMDQYC